MDMKILGWSWSISSDTHLENMYSLMASILCWSSDLTPLVETKSAFVKMRSTTLFSRQDAAFWNVRATFLHSAVLPD